jgi:flagellar basal body rod protein FlgC
MIGALSIGVSALKLSETRVAVAADNIVNASNRVPHDPATGYTGYTPRQVAPISEGTGGVRATIQPVDPAYVTVPSLQGSDEAMPNVFLAGEIVELNSASRAYESAAAIIRTADEMQDTLFDIVR